MYLLRRLFVLILSIICVGMIANADDGKKYVVEGNTYISSTGRASESLKTSYTWKDNKGNIYPIYMSSSGSCYIIKTSSKTGKQYKNYLGPDISKDICNKIGKRYKGKK